MAVVLALVEAGADVEKRGEGGVPVVGAVKGGQLAILVYLVEECGASLRHVDNYIGTILHQAAHFGHLDIVRYVAKRAPELIDAPNNYWASWTPLMTASHRGYIEVVRLLAELGCSLSLKCKSGKTALDLARHADHHDTADLLCDILTTRRMAYVLIRHEVHETGTVLPEDHKERELLHFLFGKSERGSAMLMLPRWLFGKVVGFLIESGAEDRKAEHEGGGS